jgi:hypothetical protein
MGNSTLLSPSHTSHQSQNLSPSWGQRKTKANKQRRHAAQMRATHNMKTPHSTLYRYSAETIAAANKLGLNTVDEHAHKKGMIEGEPLTIAMDAMLKYAEAYKIRMEQPLSDEGVLGDPWLEIVRNIRRLCDGDGAIAMKRNITTDSKCNGCIETVFWNAIEMAGYTEADFK